MEKLIERLLGRPFMAPDGKGGADGGAGGSNGAGGADPASGSGAGSGEPGGAAAKPSAADIAARTGAAAFVPKPAPKEDKGDDGIDPASKPKGAASNRPDHIPEKFWDGDKGQPRIDEMAKAYGTLESAMARLKQERGVPADAGEAPTDYLPKGIEFPEGVELDRVAEIKADDPAVEIFREVAHKHKLPVGVASALAADFLVLLNGKLPAPPTVDDIKAELGENSQALLDELNVWMEGQYKNGRWSEAELEYAFARFGSDATGVRLLAKLREDAGEKRIPLGRPVGKDTPSAEEWYQMNRDPRMASDVAFRERVERLGEEIFGTEPAGTSPAIGIPTPRGFDRRERAATQR